MSILKTDCFDNWWTTQERQDVRNCPCCVLLSSPLWSTVVFDRGPTRRNIRGLRRVFQPIAQQALLRVIAPSRRDQDRERFLVLPRLFCTSPLAVTTTVGFLDLHRVSSSSELKSFLLCMCIDAPESTTNSRSSGIFEVGAGIAVASTGSKT